jgi:hypothetical protein
MTASAAGARDWWLRTAFVLQAPRPVFTALRDDSPEAASERAEPVLAIVLLAGIASVLSTSTAGRLMDSYDYDGLLVAVWTFVAGSLYGGVAYWLLGAFLHAGLKAQGSEGSYRRARHVLAFAAVPLALSLALLPVKLAVYGSDVFRRGGADDGVGGDVFVALALAFLAWTAVLLVVGVRAVHGWTWGRAAIAVTTAAVIPVVLGLAVNLA